MQALDDITIICYDRKIADQKVCADVFYIGTIPIKTIHVEVDLLKKYESYTDGKAFPHKQICMLIREIYVNNSKREILFMDV